MDEFFLQAPNAEPVPIPKEVYYAMFGFLKAEDKPSGQVVIEFRGGSICRVTGQTVKIFK